MEVLAAAWGWCAGVIEMKASMALSTQVTRLAEVVAEFSGGMFTPADFVHRAVDVDDALREIRERRRINREERDAREASLAAKHEAEIARLRDQLAGAHDYARREMVWVPEQVAAAMREEAGADVEPRPHSRSNVMDEVRGLGEATERFDRASGGMQQINIPVDVVFGETEAGPHSKQETLDAAEYGARFADPLADGSIAAEFGEGPIAAAVVTSSTRPFGWTGITWMSGRGRAKSLTVPGLQTRGDLGPNALRSAEMERLSRKTVKVLQRRDRLYAFHLPGGVKRYGHIDMWSHLRAGEPLAISIRPPPRT